MTNPNFVKLSEAMGAKALRCTSLADLPAMMKEFLEYDNTRPIIMECIVSSEHVYPMVAAGKALHEQIVSSSLSVDSIISLTALAPPISQGEDRVTAVSLLLSRPTKNLVCSTGLFCFLGSKRFACSHSHRLVTMYL